MTLHIGGRAAQFGLTLLLTFLPFAACAWDLFTVTGRPIAGHVVDADTGAPLPNAQVIYQWKGSSFLGGLGIHGNQTVCYHTAAAITDAQGHFQIPPWRKQQGSFMIDAEPIGYAYARGYVPKPFLAWRGSIKSGILFDHLDDVFRLTRSRANADGRMEELWDFVRRDCSYGGNSQRALIPAFTAAYDEALVVAVAPEQQKRRRHFARMIAWAAVAPDMRGNADSSSEARIDSYMREHFPEPAPLAPDDVTFAPPAISGARRQSP